MKKDIIVSLVMLAGVGALYGSLSLMDEPRAIIFPRVLIIIMGVLALVLLAQGIFAGNKMERPALQSDRVNDDRAKAQAKGYPFWTVATCFGLIVLYFVLMEKLGFYVSAFLFFVAMTLILGRRDLNVKKGATRIGIAVIFTSVMYLLFNQLLVVQTPKGILF